MTNHTNPLFDYLFASPPISKRKVFISYHQENDQEWFDHFTGKFSEYYEIFYNKSLGTEMVESDDLDYINRVIREDYIKGSSITIVLCGAETWKRKFVDWEIYSTLHYEHAVLGIALPTAILRDGRIVVPDRLHVNVASGYAHFINWTDDASILKQHIEIALSKSENKQLIDKSLEKMSRNLI